VDHQQKYCAQQMYRVFIQPQYARYHIQSGTSLNSTQVMGLILRLFNDAVSTTETL